MKKLPIGLQTFSHLIEQDCVYIDKTALIYQLITQGSYYFFSRPRRFGKSLLISTLSALFSGKEELFAGLAISKLPYDWKVHPVIHLSFAGISCESPTSLIKGLKLRLQDIADDYDIAVDNELKPSEILYVLVKKLSKQDKVVLLIDEYDYSILQHIHKPDQAESIRSVLRDFYSTIKDLDPYFRFVFLTGVSRFSKTSIFSGLNNLNDISLSEKYNALVGYTKEEIVTSFNDHLVVLAHKMNYSQEQLLANITLWYDGYLFCHNEDLAKIYNPFSLLLLLEKHAFSNYWFETGTPTFLIKLLKVKNYPVQNFERIEASAGELGQFDIENIDLKTLLFQTGYLTIKSYDAESHNYVLGYVNKETVDSLGQHIIKAMAEISLASTNSLVVRLLKSFDQLDFTKAFELLTHFFSEIPYTIHLDAERDYQKIFYFILKMIGADIIVEQPTNVGRIDAVLQTKSYCFIIEFKINAPVVKAMKQIEEKKYYQSYLSSGKKIVLVGITFDTAARNVSEIKHKIKGHL